MTNGYVRIYRSLLEHPILECCTEATLKVWIVCLLLANWKPKEWFDGQRQITIPRGSFVTSRSRLAIKCHLSEQRTRDGIDCLRKLGCLTTQVTNHYSVVSITKYDNYQCLSDRDEPAEDPTDNQQEAQRSTNGQPTVNQRSTNGQPAEDPQLKKLRSKEVKKGTREEVKPGTPVFASGGSDAGQNQNPQNPLSEESSTEPQPSPLPPIPAAPPEAVELDDLDLDSPIETFFRNAVGRERRLKWNPSTRDGERDVERLHADDSPQFRAALLQWLADDAVKWKEIKSPVAYFRSCWESYDLAPTKNGKNGANGNGSSRKPTSREAADAPAPVSAPAPPVSTPQRSQEPLLPKYAQIWNAKMTDPEAHVKHWGKYAPRAELAEAEREPEFTEGFDKICAGCLDLMRPGGKITGVTFEWLFKICKGRPNWYQVLTGFYSWGAAPKAWVPPAPIDPYTGMTEEQISVRKAAEEKAAIENERRFTRNSKGEIIAERYGSDPEYEARIRGRKCKAEREAREAAELAARRAEVEAKTAEFVGAGK